MKNLDSRGTGLGYLALPLTPHIRRQLIKLTELGKPL